MMLKVKKIVFRHSCEASFSLACCIEDRDRDNDAEQSNVSYV